ncbi:RNA polymerase sigma factor [Edaphobacter flagellatus]|uniref:RNA polymerase sigma factor n=1 Tax=Edaphobacter flagellatus TaxID=1933044 RepID=UPI0021B1FE81|nr:sigma-70 family RNA polymerase sigma factor [Edaphobacter flagellatus]
MSSEAAAYFPDALSNGEVRPKDPACPDSSVVSVGSHVTAHPSGAMASIDQASDETLLEQVATGDKDALSQLFRRHARVVRNVAWRILRHEAEADDLVQEVFMFLFRKAALFKATHGAARSWIVQVTYSRAFNRRAYLKTRHFYTSGDLEQVMLTVAQRQSESHFIEWSLEGVWGKETATRLRQLLSPSQLVTIELHFFEGYTLEEIADRRGQTLSNVRNHYYRGLEKLRKPAFAARLRTK